MSAADAIFQQPWVTRAGWTLVHFLWQGSAIAMVLAAARALAGRRLSARGRYGLSCAALAVMTAAPLGTFVALGGVDAPALPRPVWPVAGGRPGTGCCRGWWWRGRPGWWCSPCGSP